MKQLNIQPGQDAEALADFVLFSQRSCILNLSANLNEDKVSYPQFFLLAYLAKEDFLTMSQIASMMGHSTAAATGLIDKLEELGHVNRMPAASDRRKVMVAITGSGKALVERMRSNIAQDLAQLLAQPQHEDHHEVAPARKILSRNTRTH